MKPEKTGKVDLSRPVGALNTATTGKDSPGRRTNLEGTMVTEAAVADRGTGPSDGKIVPA